MKLTIALIIASAITFTPFCFAQMDEGPEPVDMCRSLYGWVSCSEDIELTHVCFDRSSSFNCLDCTITMALLGVLDSDEESLINTTAGCLMNNFTPETWAELEHWDKDYTSSLGLALSAKDISDLLQNSVYMARFASYNLICKDETEMIPDSLTEYVTFWRESSWDNRAPIPVKIAEAAFKEQLEAEAYLFSFNCLAFYPRTRGSPPIYFTPQEDSKEELGSALVAFLAHQKITAIAVIKDSPEQAALEAKGWKVRPSATTDNFNVIIPPPIVYQFL